MKRAILLSVVAVTLLVSKSDAQCFVTSFGVTQSWGMPFQVVHAIEHDYWGYDVVHTSQFFQRGKVFYDVVLQRGNVFVRLNISSRGNIYTRSISYEYPFHNHVCSNFCGFHDRFYRRNVASCQSHYHHGHNHVVYIQNSYHQNDHNHQGNHSHNPVHKDDKRDYRDTNSYNSRNNSRDYQRQNDNRVTRTDANTYKSRSEVNARGNSEDHSRNNSEESIKPSSRSSSSTGRSSMSMSGRGAN